MAHRGKASAAGWRMVRVSFMVMAGLLLGGVLAVLIGKLVLLLAFLLILLWALFAVFALYFFRDPDPRVPVGAGLYVASGHGKVDVIDEVEEEEVMKGRCRRVSIFLSVVDVHVQNAPVKGMVTFMRHRAGEFRNALRTDSAAFNENVLIGIESGERTGERVAVRLIAGLIARRIVPWVVMGEEVERGGRIGLIQFGSRVDMYLPMDVEVSVRLGDHVVGGETVVARRVS